MNRREFALASASALAVLGLAGCKPKDESPAQTASLQPPADTKVTPQQAYENASHATGFTVGPVMAANTVYVFFDPTCPHCAHLWNDSKALAGRLKMVWIPIGLLQRKSEPLSATILTSSDPAAAMQLNEASVLDNKGGIPVNRSIPEDVVTKVRANTDIFKKLGAESVPLIVYKNGRTGQFGTHAGAVPAEQLAAMAGV
ncbi:MAG TPA: thioredoxin fold domain-containing protein [Burkholderiaceae bacterium]|nr:thioredoxin fold domain-containing protein [Burkholderiaceae bacterium]